MMKFVATKTADQLDLQALHRVRERLVSGPISGRPYRGSLGPGPKVAARKSRTKRHHGPSARTKSRKALTSLGDVNLRGEVEGVRAIHRVL
jgi:hypothetical protein